MTIRDIAIAIGFEIDDASLKKAEKTVEKAKKRWEKTLKSLIVEIKLKVPKTLVQSGSAPVAKPPSPTEAPNTAPLEEQENITDEILNNQRKINDEVDEQAAKQRRVNEEEKKGKKHTEEQAKKKRTIRDLLNGIFGKSKQVTNETKKQTAAEQKHQQELKQTKAAYQQIAGVVSSTMGKLVGIFGLGFSLVQLKQISEEFNGINDQIRDATRGMGEQSEIQQRILKAANDSRTSYGETAKFVGNLVQENKELFGTVEEAAGYAELTSKLFKAAGKSNEQVTSLQEAINNSFGRGKLDGETISQLLENAPEYVKLLEKELGATKDQFEDMATNGQISLAALKNAVVNNADTINASFNELDLNLSDALLNIRNQWGLWVDKINSQYGATKKLSYFLMNFFSKLLGWLDKGVQMLNRLADKVGGMENLLKLVAMAAGSIWLALNASKILGFFKSLGGLLTMANLKTLALVAVIMLVALAIDDLIHFMKGDESVIGEFFEKMGIDADAVRETIGGVISFLGSLISTIADLLGKGLEKLGEFFAWSTEKAQQAGEKIGKAIRSVMDWFGNLKEKAKDLIDTIANSPLGKLIGGVGNAIGKGWDYISGLFSKDPEPVTVANSTGGSNRTSNVTIQNHINNTFNGSDREMQQKGAEQMNKAVNDSSDEAARAFAMGY
ncbi:MAG: tape measure protein [Negativibacillus sp.]